MRRYLLTSLVALSFAPQGLNAAPESWVNPTHTFTGNPGSGFGSAVSCSSVVSELGQSYFAVGAPQEDGGRVHIYEPSGLVQTLSGTGGEFGYAVTFVKDINDDGIDELLVGEPYSFTAPASGNIYMYLSTQNLAAPYAICGSKLGVVGFGSHVLSMSTVVFGGVQIVVGNPHGSRVDSFNVTDAAGVCFFEEASNYTWSMSGGQRYGQSIGEISEANFGISRLIVGAPGDGFDPDIEGCSPSGGVYAKYEISPPAPILPGSSSCSGEKFGTAIAANTNSALMAFLAPRELSGQTLYVRIHDVDDNLTPVCTASIPMPDLADSASHALVHLQTIFASLVGNQSQAVFGSYRSEASTGGSVALIGAAGSACLEPKQINNCALDANQRQGQVLAGGPTCVDSSGRKLLIVGAPGYSNNAGRIDVYAEGTQLGSVAPCGAPTNTPTVTPTATGTAIPQATATPAPVLTEAPGSDDTPIPVDQRTRGLPEPQVIIRGTLVDIFAPRLSSKSRGLRLIGYDFTVSATRAKAAISVLTVKAFGKTFKKRQLFSKRNRVSLRGLKLGSYIVSYRPVFSTNRGKRVVGKFSKPATFTVR